MRNLHTELDRIQQVLANNNYQQHPIEKMIQNRLNNHLQADVIKDKKGVEFYYQLNNLSTFKQDTKRSRTSYNVNWKPRLHINTYLWKEEELVRGCPYVISLP